MLLPRLGLRYSQPFRKRSQISGKQDTVRPAGFLAPEVPKVVANSIISGLGKGFMPAFAKSVVTLGDLPDF
jgi:hypothetical protein